MVIDYDGQLSPKIEICRGAPQGSVFGPMAYIVAHHDLPEIFERPENVHLYVDDLAIAYTPSIYLDPHEQREDIQRIMNKDLEKLYVYTTTWHQPVNVGKSEYVIYHRAVQSPKIKVVYNKTSLLKKTEYKYLGFRLDAKLSFHHLLDDQLIKLRKAYIILKYIHNKFPSYFNLKKKFFNTYAWPHMLMLSTIYCLLSTTAQNRINGFHRRCLRLIYCLFQCSNNDLHVTFNLPTLESQYKKCLINRLRAIQLYEPELIACYLSRKNITNITYNHYEEKPCIPWLQQGRPNNKIVEFYYNRQYLITFFDKLINFIL